MLACYFLIQRVQSGGGYSLTPTPSPSPLFTPWRPTQGPVPFVQPDTHHAPLGTFVPCPWVCFMHGLELMGCPVLLPSLTLLSWRAFPTLPAEVTFRWVTHNSRGGGPRCLSWERACHQMSAEHLESPWEYHLPPGTIGPDH